MTNFVYILICISFTVIGQLLIKNGSTNLKEASSIIEYCINIHIVLGLLSAVIAAVAWIKALQYYELSYAYPFMSLSFLLVSICSVLFFNEAVSGKQWLGLFIVLIGLYIGSR